VLLEWNRLTGVYDLGKVSERDFMAGLGYRISYGVHCDIGWEYGIITTGSSVVIQIQ
jgi:hypothetical protein